MHRFFMVYTAALTLFLTFMLSLGLYFPVIDRWPHIAMEDGIVENTTAVVFFVTSAIAFSLWVFNRTHCRLVFFILMAMAGMRELDWHKAWTSDSVLKTKFYLMPDVPLLEKMAGGGVILLLAYAAFFALRQMPIWINNLKNLSRRSWSIAFALGLLTIAKTLDSMTRIFPFLEDFHKENSAYLQYCEEILELGGALFLLLTAVIMVQVKFTHKDVE